MASATRATAATHPMTIPTIIPVLEPPSLSLGVDEGATTGCDETGVDDGDTDEDGGTGEEDDGFSGEEGSSMTAVSFG